MPARLTGDMHQGLRELLITAPAAKKLVNCRDT